jgi:hypothetical protein
MNNLKIILHSNLGIRNIIIPLIYNRITIETIIRILCEDNNEFGWNYGTYQLTTNKVPIIQSFNLKIYQPLVEIDVDIPSILDDKYFISFDFGIELGILPRIYFNSEIPLNEEIKRFGFFSNPKIYYRNILLNENKSLKEQNINSGSLLIITDLNEFENTLVKSKILNFQLYQINNLIRSFSLKNSSNLIFSDPPFYEKEGIRYYFKYKE